MYKISSDFGTIRPPEQNTLRMKKNDQMAEVGLGLSAPWTAMALAEANNRLCTAEGHPPSPWL